MRLAAKSIAKSGRSVAEDFMTLIENSSTRTTHAGLPALCLDPRLVAPYYADGT